MFQWGKLPFSSSELTWIDPCKDSRFDSRKSSFSDFMDQICVEWSNW